MFWLGVLGFAGPEQGSVRGKRKSGGRAAVLPVRKASAGVDRRPAGVAAEIVNCVFSGPMIGTVFLFPDKKKRDSMIKSNFLRLLGRPLQLQAYCWLLSRVDENGIADASPTALAAALDETLRRAKYALKSLKKEGMIRPSGRGQVSLGSGAFVPFVSQSLSQNLSHPDTSYVSGFIDDNRPDKDGNCPSFCPSFCPSSVPSLETGPAPAAFSAAQRPFCVPPEAPEGPGMTEEKQNQKGMECPSSVLSEQKSGRESYKSKKRKESLPAEKWMDLSARWVEDSKKRHPSKTRSYGRSHILAGARALESLAEKWKYDWETEIRPVLLWARQDSFWSPQILSLGGLAKRRENGALKFENVAAKMEQATSSQSVRQVETISLDEYRAQSGGKIKNSIAF